MTPEQHPAPGDERAIDLAAAEWLVKRDRGFTAEEQDNYFQWLAADPRHGAWIARHRSTWTELDTLAQWRPEHSAEPNPDLLAKPAPRRPLLRFAAALAAAAAVAFAAWQFRPAPSVPIAPAAGLAVRGAATDEERILEDGSVVALRAGAQLVVDFSPRARRIELGRGEARFTVARDAARPFFVRAGGIEVRAVGTVFNVRLDGAAVEVLVTEGKVRVDDATRGASVLAPVEAGEEPVLRAGQKVFVEPAPAATPAPRPAIEPVRAGDVARLEAWRPQSLEFESTPLGRVVTEFNRHNQVQLELADPALEGLPIVASFRPDNAEAFVRLLERSAGVRAERTGDRILLRAQR